MKRSVVQNAVKLVVPAGASQALAGHDAQRDAAWMERAKERLKERCRNLYRSSVYCSACDYEIGANPECPQCTKAMKQEHRQSASSTHGLLA
jgi:uncharacterized paraquat-inducible protein A